MIKAITFDLWDTIVDDDSDEPKRAAQGLRSKYDQRRHLVHEALKTSDPVDYDDVVLAYDTADAGFNLVWRELQINWTVAQRLSVVLKGLGRQLAEPDMAALVEATGQMEVEIPPDPVPGIGGALEVLSSRYKLAVVSDAIVTPGTGLRQILDHYGLARYFSAFAFSDEVGHSKPHRAMFESACGQLGVGLEEIVHIGDRDHNDVKGPQALGAKAVLFTATRPADKDTTTAEAICESHDALPAIIDRLAAES
jgi:putative hydrolase of the HAD superfamily